MLGEMPGEGRKGGQEKKGKECTTAAVPVPRFERLRPKRDGKEEREGLSEGGGNVRFAVLLISRGPTRIGRGRRKKKDPVEKKKKEVAGG